MPLYSYRAVNLQGSASKGTQDAANLIDLEARLKRSGLDLVHAKEDNNKSLAGRKKSNGPELITFFF
jgi:hypothetical protein